MWKEEDYQQYRHLGDGHCREQHSMDPLHVAMIYEQVTSRHPLHAVEIGALWGYSTSAFVQARKDGWTGKLTVVDIDLTDKLQELVKDMTNYHLVKADGAAGLRDAHYCDRIPVEMVLVDGNHSWTYVIEEYSAIQEIKPFTVIAHDVSHIDGPARMLADIRKSGLYHVIVDDMKRDGMWTDRGLMIARRK